MFFKAIYALLRTLRYLLVSYRPGADILRLKKEWAEELLGYFGLSLEVTGTPPTGHPVILLGNHVSFTDIMAVMAACPEVVFLAKKEVGEWPIIGPTARRVGTLFVDRTRKDKDHVRRQISDELLRTKSQLVVFPSGTTTLEEELPWKKGMFEVSREYGIPIQTFAVTYSHKELCAYIGDDSMLETMQRMLKVPGKKVRLEWLEAEAVPPSEDPVAAAERRRLQVVAALSKSN